MEISKTGIHDAGFLHLVSKDDHVTVPKANDGRERTPEHVMSDLLDYRLRFYPL